MAAHISWDLFKLPVKALIYSGQTLSSQAIAVYHLDLNDFVEKTVEGLTKIFRSVHADIGDLLADPLCAIGVETAAIAGIFFPQYGRKYEAMVEKLWQHGNSFRNDRRLAEDPEWSWSWVVDEIEHPKPLYLAYCFQPRHNMYDAEYLKKKRVVQRGNHLPCLNYLPA
jgi:hypothetical protein